MNNQPLELSILDYEETMLSIKRGVAMLDEAYPRWEHQIELSELSLSDATSCVLGQLGPHYSGHIYHHYDQMLRQLCSEGHLEDESQVTQREHGFITPDLEGDGGITTYEDEDNGWGDLEKMWLQVIENKRGY